MMPPGDHWQRTTIYIDQQILSEIKTRRKNQVLAWIDKQKKVYDIVPQSRIFHCLKMYKIPDEVKKFIEKTIETWKVELTAGRKGLAGLRSRKA